MWTIKNELRRLISWNVSSPFKSTQWEEEAESLLITLFFDFRFCLREILVTDTSTCSSGRWLQWNSTNANALHAAPAKIDSCETSKMLEKKKPLCSCRYWLQYFKRFLELVRWKQPLYSVITVFNISWSVKWRWHRYTLHSCRERSENRPFLFIAFSVPVQPKIDGLRKWQMSNRIFIVECFVGYSGTGTTPLSNIIHNLRISCTMCGAKRTEILNQSQCPNRKVGQR